jgi:hypothetical protein
MPPEAILRSTRYGSDRLAAEVFGVVCCRELRLKVGEVGAERGRVEHAGRRVNLREE